MADQILDEILSRQGIKGDIDFLIEQLKRGEDAFVSLKTSRDSVRNAGPLSGLSGNIKQSENDTRALTSAQKELTAARREQLQVESQLKIELLELKKRNAELTIQAKEKLAADNEALKASKEKAAADKQAAADSVTAGREKILRLKEERDELEKLEQAAKDRATTEQQVLSGNYNPGGGKGNARPNEPLTLSVSQGNIALLKAYENEINKVGAEVKKAEAAFKAGEISQNAYKKVVVESVEKIRSLKASVSDLNREMKLTENVNNAERNSLERAQALIAKYTFEKKKLNLATEEGRLLNENYNKAIKNSNEFILKNADAETQRTKNIGNYGSALNKILGPLRTIANIIPGIGLSGLFLLAFEGIQKAIEALGLFNSKVFGAKEQMKLLSEVNKEASENAGKEAGSLRVLRAEIENTEIPMGKRLQAIKNLRDQYPELLKNTTDEALLQGNAAKAYDLVAKSILKKAQAQAAEAQIQKLTSDSIDILLKQNIKADEVNKKIQNTKADATISSGGTAGGGGNFGGASKSAKQQALVDEFNDQKAADRKLLDLNNEKIKFLTKFAAIEENIKPGPKPGKTAATLEATKATLDSDFEIYKINQQRKIKLLDDETNDQKNSFDERIKLLNAFSTASIELIDRQEKEELRKNEAKQKALQANLGKSTGTARNNLLIEIQNNETARGVIEAKAASDRISVFDANEKKYTDIVDFENKRRLKIQKDAYDKTMKLIDDEAANKRAKADDEFTAGADGLQQRFEQGKISLKKYNQERAELDFAYGIESLQIEIDAVKKKLAVSALLPTEKGKALQELAKLEKKLATDVVAHHKKTEAEKIASTLKTLKDIQDASVVVFGLIDGVLNARQIATKNKLKEESDAAEKKAARDIELVNASTLSEQDKAAKITVINARLAAQKEQIAQKEKKAEQDRAKFQKAVTVFNIILSTTLAVIKAYTEGDPYTKVARAIIAGVAGAAQLAIALATPIPKYFMGKGKGDKYEGLAIVNDGPRLEVIERADGSIEMPGGRNVLTHVGKDDIIHSDREAWVNEVIKAAFRDSHSRGYISSKAGEDPLSKKMDVQNRLLKQIAEKKELHLGASEGGMVALWKYGANQASYLNENTNWV